MSFAQSAYMSFPSFWIVIDDTIEYFLISSSDDWIDDSGFIVVQPIKTASSIVNE